MSSSNTPSCGNIKVLVTGAAGFVGSHLCERLLAMCHEVIGLDCFTDYYALALKEQNANKITAKGAQILPLDLASEKLSAAIKGVEIVYHLAAQPGISAHVSFQAYLRNNIIATYRLLEAVSNSSSLRCFVNISTSSVYGDHATDSEQAAPKPTSYYGVTKLAAEQLVMSYCRQKNLPACSIRLFSVYGPRERPEKLYPKLIKSILEQSEFPLYEDSEKHSRSFTYVADAVDGLVAVLFHLDVCLGQIFNIGSDTEITTAQGIQLIEKIMGQNANIVVGPKRPGDQLVTCASIDKARKILQYNPATTLEQGLKSEIEWYKNEVFGKIDLM